MNEQELENPFDELTAILEAELFERDDEAAYQNFYKERAAAIEAINNGELVIEIKDKYALGDMMFEIESIERVLRALANAELIDDTFTYDSSQPNPYYKFITESEVKANPNAYKTYTGIVEFLRTFISKYPRPSTGIFRDTKEIGEGKFAEGKTLVSIDYLDIPYKHEPFIPKLRRVNGIKLFETVDFEEIAEMQDRLYDTLLYRDENGEYKNTINDVIFILQTGSNDHKRFSNLDLVDTTDFIHSIDPNKIVVIVSDSEVVDKDIPGTDKVLTENGFQITRGEDFEEFFHALNQKGQKRLFLSSKDFNITAALLGTKFQTITTDSLLEWVCLAVKTGLISTRDLEPSELIVLNTLYGKDWHIVDTTMKGAIHVDSEFITIKQPLGKMSQRQMDYELYFGAPGIARQDMDRLFQTLREHILVAEI